jgi:hypothetical protein
MMPQLVSDHPTRRSVSCRSGRAESLEKRLDRLTPGVRLLQMKVMPSVYIDVATVGNSLSHLGWFNSLLLVPERR